MKDAINFTLFLILGICSFIWVCLKLFVVVCELIERFAVWVFSSFNTKLIESNK